MDPVQGFFSQALQRGRTLGKALSTDRIFYRHRCMTTPTPIDPPARPLCKSLVTIFMLNVLRAPPPSAAARQGSLIRTIMAGCQSFSAARPALVRIESFMHYGSVAGRDDDQGLIAQDGLRRAAVS